MRKILNFFGIITILLLSATIVLAAEEEENPVIDALPELIVAGIGIGGLIFLIIGTKDITGSIGNLLKMIKLGFGFIATAFLIVAVGELMGQEEGLIEILFELFATIGMLILCIGPIKLKKALA